MRFSNRAARKSIGILLAASGFMLAWAQLAVAQEPAPLAATPQESTWTPTLSAPPEVANEMREALRSELKTEMIAALQPDSTVWKGALDGYRLALQMRDEMREQLRGDMIAEMHVALGDFQRSDKIDPHADQPEAGDPQSRIVQYGRFEVPTMPSIP